MNRITKRFCEKLIAPGEAGYFLRLGKDKKPSKIRWVNGKDDFPEPDLKAHNWMGPVARDPEKWTDSWDDAGNVALLRTRTIWVDFDDIELEEALARGRKHGIPEPSVILHSGNGIHFHFLLGEPLDVSTPEKLENFESVLRGITKTLDADMGAAKAAQVMRIPGTPNIKPDSKRKFCQVVGGNMKTYPFSRFERYALDSKPSIDPNFKQKRKEPETHKLDTGQFMSLVEVFLPIYSNGKRHRMAHAISGLLRKKGVPKEQTQRLLNELKRIRELNRLDGGTDHSHEVNETYNNPIETIAVWAWAEHEEDSIEALKEAISIIGMGSVRDRLPECNFCKRFKHGRCSPTVCGCSCVKKKKR